MAGLDPAIQSHDVASQELVLDGRLKAAHGEASYCNFRKYIPPGVLISPVTPVGVRWPLFLSTLNSVILPPFSLAAKNQLPVGSKRILRGVRPPDGTFSRLLSSPLLGSMVKIATLSWPRLPT